MTRLTLRANAKVNLGLEIVGVRQDGYHLIETIFQELDFGDRLTFRRRDDSRCVLASDHPDFPLGEENLCHQAYELMADRYPDLPGVTIRAEKAIPAGAGLGGGSSNAAATLLALAKLGNLPVDSTQLQEMAESLGADVPFFLYGGTARGSGIGAQITPLDWTPNQPIVLVLPEIHISTAWAYREAGYTLTENAAGDKLQGFFDRKSKWQRLGNAFEPLIEERYPEIGDIRQRLHHLRADLVRLSGSGAAIFGIYPDTDTARKAVRNLSQDYRTVLTEAVHRTQPWYATVLSR